MAHSRGSSRGRVLQPQRRKTSWEPGPGGTAITALSGTGSQFVGSAVVPIIPGLTAVRLRGRLSWFLKLATAVDDGFQGAFGIGLATLAAVTAGIASVPTPITEIDSDNWMYWTPISGHGPVVSSTALDGATHQDIEVDTKAMRKFDDVMSIYAAVEIVEQGTATASLYFDSRMLVMLA